jgi:hypothetical protein
MVVTFLGSQVPAPQTVGTIKFKTDYNAGSSLPAYTSAEHVETGDTFWSSKFNQNAALLDIIAQVGGGVIAVVSGLDLTAGTGLTLNIAAGTALINGVIQLKNATSIAITDNSTRYIWFKSNGTFEATSTTTPPASMPSVFVGIVVTSAGAITKVDKSGVVYFKSGSLIRETNDTTAPTGSVDSSIIILTKTLAGTYIWDGFSTNLVKGLLPNQTSTVQNITSNKTENSSDRDYLTTNTGAGSKPIITLEPAAIGVVRKFFITNSVGIRVKANTGDTIRIVGNITASGGYVESTTVGGHITLMCYQANSWIAVDFLAAWTNGTWTADYTNSFV